MNAGSLRERLTVERAVETRDSVGGVTVTWGVLATMWAEALPAAGREYWAAGQTVGEGAVRFRARYLSGITAKDRVLWRGKYYNLRGDPADVGGRQREMELVCTELPP